MGLKANGRRRRYVRRPNRTVTAVRLPKDCDGLVYRKWGGKQRAKPGDWIVDNDGDVYTVDARVFARTYRKVANGAYVKTTPVWAQRATTSGSVRTKEGATRYRRGDYLVSNSRDGSDAYAMTSKKFDELYKPTRVAKRRRSASRHGSRRNR